MAINSLDIESTKSDLSYGQILREVATSAKNLVQSEVRLLTAELKDHLQKMKDHSVRMVVAIGLLVLSVFPFLAFLVIGLGELLDGRYWLSSLIVALVFGAVGGIMTMQAMKKLKADDLSLPETSSEAGHGIEVVQQKTKEMKNATKGGSYGQAHHAY